MKRLVHVVGLMASFAAAAATELIPNTLPEGYRQVEYVSFPYGTYVDTGLKPSNVQITMRFDTLPTYRDNMHLFGSEGGGSRIHFTEYGRTWYWGTKGTEANSSKTCSWVAGVHELVFGERGTGDIKLDGAVIGGNAAENDTAGYDLRIGSRNKDQHNFTGHVYSFAITNADGTAALDLVPAIRESDLLVGFYDRVSGRFLGPSGGRLDASLSYREYEVLEGVHLSSKAYFDTGIAVTNCEISMTYRKDAYRDNDHMFGSGNGSRYTHLTEFGKKWVWGVNGQEIMSAVVDPWVTGLHRVVFSQNGTATGDVVVDGKVVGTGTIGHHTWGQTLCLGERDGADTSYDNRHGQYANFDGEIYAFAATNRAGVAVMNLIPCRRKATGDVGFYDIVNSRFIRAFGDTVPGASEDAGRYEEIPYVTFSNGAYVDLGYPVENVQITMKFDTTYVSDRHMFGQNTGARYIQFTEWGDKWVWGSIDKETMCSTVKPVGGLHELVYAKIGSGDVIVDGQTLGTGVTANNTNGRNLLIGCRSNTPNFVGDVYYFTVTNFNGTAVADLVPRRRLLDNAIGFLDRVSGKFYTLSGNGSFTAGTPTDLYKPVPYVDFPVMGGYVDTGVAVPADAEVRVKFEADYFNNRHIIGQEISNGYLHFTSFGNKWYWGTNNGEANSGSVAWSGGVHTLVYQEKSTANVTLDGTVLGQAVKGNTRDRPLLIGSRNGQNYFVGKIYYVTATNNQNGACILDLRPCVRKADGKYGFYEARTGRFVTSPLLGYELSPDPVAPTADIRTMYNLRTNGAYVDTGLFADDGLKVISTYRTADDGPDQVLFGAVGYDYDCLCRIGSQGRTCEVKMGAGTGTTDRLKPASNHTVTLDHAAAQADTLALFSGGATMSGKVASRGIRLFGTWNKAVAEEIDPRRFVGRGLGFRAFANDVLVRDLVPAQRLSNGTVGFLDMVSGVFFESQGGLFAAGPESRPGLMLLLK